MDRYENREYHGYNYLSLSKNRLNTVVFNEGKVKNLRKKFTTAAIIALTSGTTVLFTTNQVKAATTSEQEVTTAAQNAATNDQQKMAEANKILPKQGFTQDVDTQDTNTTSKQEQDTIAQTQTVNQATTKQDDDGEQAQTQDEAGHKDANGVELPANNQDHVKGNVQSAWDQGYKGQHIVVAVIDSGVDTDHKDFSTMPEDPKLSADKMKELIDKLGYGQYVNEKFPFVYNAIDHDNQHLKNDDVDHGQHVSGIIAADGHPDGDQEYVVGVAPEAQLMHFRIFNDGPSNIDIAKQIYDATNLGADIIQMSLGGGVAAADLNDAEQRAVQYAIDHGVIVSISASNNGNSTSVQNPSNITDENYSAGGAAGNYKPFNSGTVANPGAAQGAVTGASETSGLGQDSDMSSFSSWGPLPDYTLKPDLSAPGDNVISLGNTTDDGESTYVTKSGTSMAGPFIAGAAALVKQRLQQTNPELQGADLVYAVKAILMNSANPQIQNGYTTIVSPRRQGAGQINVGAATAAPAYVIANDKTGSLSLRNIGDSNEFELTFNNLTNQTQTYTFDASTAGGYTEVREDGTGIFHDVQLAGTQVSGQDTIVLQPNEKGKKVKFTLTLTGINKNQLVEGYLTFTNTDGKSTISVPYLGYYGDMTSENVFDKNANEENPDIAGNRLTNEDNYPRGIADQESLKELVNVEGEYNWQEVAKLYETGKVAFSPNDDNKSDIIMPYEYLKQNVQDLKVEILDANGKVVRVLADSHGAQKSYNDDGTGTVDTLYSVNNGDAYKWDGKVYDPKTGEMKAAPDGQYTYRFVATLYNDGPNKVQTNDTPVIIDTVAPVLENVKYDAATQTISGNYSDEGAGFTNYSYATVTINDHVFGFKLNDDGESKFDNSDKTQGHFSFVLTPEEKQVLATSKNKISVAISDVADNTVVKTLDVAPVAEGNQVAVWNAVNGLPYNETSSDYNEENNTYLLRGSANKDFYLNGKLVNVQNGEFVVPVSLDDNNLVFSSDEKGEQVLGKFTTYTPKAQFAWQHVDGEETSFGISVYSVYGDNPNDIVVQAAVPKGDNVKAFARDYFTGEQYTGEIKDGVATFHVHTSINQDPTTNINRRALLHGWVEVNGPTYNDKQISNLDEISNTYYIGVYYDPDAQAKTYTNRDDLGTDFTDKAADPSDFGPGQYPGHDNSIDEDSNISFDYVTNNGMDSWSRDAIAKGYYDPATKTVIVTGHVGENVVSLIALQDKYTDTDPESKVDISDGGKFTLRFKVDDPSMRQLAYYYDVKDEDGEIKTVKGSIAVILDTVLPTVNVDQLPSGQDSLVITTNNPTFRLSGNVNDNIDGYSVFINGDNVFTQFSGNSYDYIPGMYGDSNQKTPNLYGGYKFDQEFNLDDENGKPSTHVFKVQVVDQVGNSVTKMITVKFDPNAKTETQVPGETPDQDTDNIRPVVPTPVVPLTRDEVNNNNIKNNESITGQEKPTLDDETALILPRNVIVYDENGKALKKRNNQDYLKKGTQLKDKHIVEIGGSSYYKVGKNKYVKAAATAKDYKFHKAILIKNSFIYDLNGKTVKNKGKRILLKKGKTVNILNSGKTHKIGKHVFYQIGVNQFVKVNNVAV